MPVIKLPTGSYYYSGRINWTRGSMLMLDAYADIQRRTRWRAEPLSAKKLCADSHYRKWARDTYDLGPLARFLIATWRREGRRETREEMFKAIAKLLGEDWKTVRAAANRSSKVIPKRRQQIKL